VIQSKLISDKLGNNYLGGGIQIILNEIIPEFNDINGSKWFK